MYKYTTIVGFYHRTLQQTPSGITDWVIRNFNTVRATNEEIEVPIN
ncbi:MAG: hypothetical protein WA951_06895 [Leeuwenhoekiella sp.]